MGVCMVGSRHMDAIVSRFRHDLSRVQVTAPACAPRLTPLWLDEALRSQPAYLFTLWLMRARAGGQMPALLHCIGREWFLPRRTKPSCRCCAGNLFLLVCETDISCLLFSQFLVAFSFSQCNRCARNLGRGGARTLAPEMRCALHRPPCIAMGLSGVNAVSSSLFSPSPGRTKRSWVGGGPSSAGVRGGLVVLPMHHGFQAMHLGSLGDERRIVARSWRFADHPSRHGTQ